MDNTQSGADSQTERIGDTTVKPPVNAPINRNTVSKMANLLEGLQFLATKEDIKNHLNRKSPSIGNEVDCILSLSITTLRMELNMTIFML